MGKKPERGDMSQAFKATAVVMGVGGAVASVVSKSALPIVLVAVAVCLLVKVFRSIEK